MASWHIAMNLVKRTMGSRRGLIMNVLLPAIILAVITGLFSGLQGRNPAIIIVNLDEGVLGQEMIAALQKEKLYEISEETAITEERLKQAVLDREADAAIYIPADYSRKMAMGEIAQPVLYRMDEQLWNAALAATLSAEASRLAATSELARAAMGEPDEALLQSLLEAQAIPAVTALHSSMKLGTIISEPLMPGLMLMFLMLLMNQTIGFIMEDRELRTMARMYTAPLRSIDIALGNFMGSVLIGTLQMVIVLGLAYYAFGFSPGISFGGMLLVLECFLLAALGLVSTVAGMVRNRSQLSQLNLLITMPTCMISGCFFPISFMPDIIQKLANFTPQKWVLQALDLLAGGKSLAGIGIQLAILLLFAVLLLAFGAAVLRPSRTSH
jgi:ABC-2 type transport system permease protein